MADRRLFEDSDNDPDRTNHKRLKTPKPSSASSLSKFSMGDDDFDANSVIKEVLYNNIRAALDPMIRQMGQEEVEDGLWRYLRSLKKSPPLRTEVNDDQPSLKLIFPKKLTLLPLFTGTKITDADGKHLEVHLVDADDAEAKVYTDHPPVKIKIVVLDGDFPSSGDLDEWTTEEFNRNVLRERPGKRPLLAGDELSVVMSDGVCSFGKIEFTDNSSWLRSRRFRLGATVAPGKSNAQGQGVRIRPAMTTESFVVKDRRCESYQKHNRPALGDEVWRLKGIGKGGVFHGKLSKKGINTVQDFLKLSVVDRLKLRQADIEKLAQHAYANWSSLQEIDESQVNETALLTIDQYNVGQSQYPPSHQSF